MPATKRLSQAITELLDAERAVRTLRAEISSATPASEALDALAEAIQAARREDAEDERILRLSALATALGRMSGARTVDLLIDLLDSEEPEVRLVAGSQLEDLAFDRFKEVANGIERALTRLERGRPALSELPFVIVDVPEPGVLKVLHQFLGHVDPEAVAAGIEACVEIGDPKSVSQLRKLRGDKRTVEIEDEPETVTVTLGELADEARELLESQGD